MKKSYIIILLLVILFTLLFLWTGNNNKSKIAYKNTSDEVVETRSRYDQPGKFYEYHQAIRTRHGDKYPGYKYNYRFEEYKKSLLQQNQAARINQLQWIERGPGNVPGRTRGLIILPNDPSGNTWLAGSAGGGIWKTTDAGQNWSNKTPDLPNLSTTTLALSEANPDVIYAGTGEGFLSTGFVNGNGIFKSTNGGESWTQIPFTASEDFGNVNRVIVDPANENIVLACTSNGLYSSGFTTGIYRSADGGSSWTKVFEANRHIQQIVYAPSNFNIQYATINSTGVAMSTDAGQTWSLISKGIFPSGRVEIAVAPDNPDLLYASCEGELSGNGSDFYISEDGAQNWSLVVEKDNGTNYDFLDGQGWFDNTVAVHPFQSDVVYVGGVDLWKLTMVDGQEEGDETVLGVDEIDTDFLDFVSFQAAEFYEGKLAIGDASKSLFTSVEIRFGIGISQKAHRFTVPENAGTNSDGGAGVPDSLYQYQDYVEVPFQVWDIDNNKQLMVSFRDQQRDGQFQLKEQNTEGDASNHSREYIFIHSVDYSEVPNPLISVDGGHIYNQTYFMWPVLADDQSSFNQEELPESKIVISYGSIIKRFRETINLTDGRDQYDGKNGNDVIHVDHHNIQIDEVTEGTFRMIVANDGGVYYSNTDQFPGETQGSWNFAGNEYNTTQFYGADKKPSEDVYAGGSQDNGTWMSSESEDASSSSEYQRLLEGDGFDVVWHYTEPEKIIGSIYYNDLRKSTDGGQNFSSATRGVADIGEGNSPFITKIANTKTNPDVLFIVGASGVWKSVDFADTWELSKIDDKWGFNGLSDVAISLANNQIVWAGGAMTNASALHLSTDGGESFTSVNSYTQEMGAISGLATHPLEDSTAYALFSFANAPKILRTTDLGSTWEDISGFGVDDDSNTGFPDVAVYALLVHPHDPSTIWVGTEIGLVISDDNGQSWSYATGNLPAVSIWDMKVVDDQVVAATHGRGIWTIDIPDLPETVIVPKIEGLGVGVKSDIAMKVAFRSAYDSVKILKNEEVVMELGQTPISKRVFSFSPTGSENVSFRITGYQSGKSFISLPRSITFYPIDDYVTSYENDFNDNANDDFDGNGFSITTPSGFDNGAIHSTHDYENSAEYLYNLRKAILINGNNNSLIEFEEIAIVEPGEEDAAFGSTDFYDYVVVEGSSDGLEWIALDEGYDAAKFRAWRRTYDDGLEITSNLFANNTINLRDTFNPEDTVLIRFRLFSDPFETAWGWAIDNLNIQNNPIASINDEIQKYNLTIYPNPVNDIFIASYQMAKNHPVEIKIFNIKGEELLQKTVERSEIGLNEVKFNISYFKNGVYFIHFNMEDKNHALKFIKN